RFRRLAPVAFLLLAACAPDNGTGAYDGMAASVLETSEGDAGPTDTDACAAEGSDSPCGCPPTSVRTSENGSCVAVAPKVDGLRVELACLAHDADGAAGCPTQDMARASGVLSGATFLTYRLRVRIRGVVEPKTYQGGTGESGYFVAGGVPADDGV